MSDESLKKEIRHDLGGCLYALKMADKMVFEDKSGKEEAREMLKVVIEKLDQLMKKLG